MTERQPYGDGWGTQVFSDVLQDLRLACASCGRTQDSLSPRLQYLRWGLPPAQQIYPFVHAALMTPLPYRHASELVALYERIPVGDRYHLSAFDYDSWKQLNRLFYFSRRVSTRIVCAM